MNKRFLTTAEVTEFLDDFEKNSETFILEEGKEKNELITIAKAKGIQLKDSTDLAGFKTIYTFASKANANKRRLNKDQLLKSLPGIIGKPVNIDHIRRYVVGHYIDYRYKAKEDMVVAYGVFYKSNFEDEWEQAKQLFKDKKLTTSYEIWSPNDKRKKRQDGTEELMEMEIAGGALLFKEEPAFKEAKVLQLAKRNMERQHAENLIFAKYKQEDILISNKLEASELTVEEPTDVKDDTPKNITCSNCKETFNYLTEKEIGMGAVKCPKCFAIVDQTGNMLHPPQIIDFALSCPSCKSRNWLVLSRTEEKVRVRCYSCSKSFTAEYAKSYQEELSKFNFVYDGRADCPQCGNSRRYQIIGKPGNTGINMTCSHCKLKFNTSSSIKTTRRLKSISEITEQDLNKSSTEGGERMLKFEVTDYHRFADVDDFDTLVEASLDNELASEDAKKLTTEERNALPDAQFALVVRVRDKKSGEMKKVRKYPVHDEADVRNALARLNQNESKEELRNMEVKIDNVLRKAYKRATQLNMTSLLLRNEDELKRLGLSVPKVIAAEDVEREVAQYKIEIATLTANLADLEKSSKEEKERLEKELASVKTKSEASVAFYKDNARLVLSRREELGDHGSELSDEDLVNPDKYKIAKLEMEKSQLQDKKLETASDTVADNEMDESEYKAVRDKIDKTAFGVTREEAKKK